MAKIDSFDTARIGPRTFLGVRVECYDATEALEVLNDIKGMLAVKCRTVADVVIGDSPVPDDYAAEERAAIQDDGPPGPRVGMDPARVVAAFHAAVDKADDSPPPPPPSAPVDRDDIEAKRREEEEARLAAEARAKLPKPPADELAEYAAAADGGGVPSSFPGYKAGERYDGVEILKARVHRDKGYGVMLLKDGTKVQYNPDTGHEIARKGGPAVDNPNDLEVVPTSRQTGVRAPEHDDPVEDTIGTPAGEVPEWLIPVVDADTFADAVDAALGFVPAGDLPDWVVAHRDTVPAFARVAADKLRGRVERQLLVRG